MTDGVSYCLRIAVIITLSVVSSWTLVPDSHDSTDVTHSKQFQKNLAISKFRNNSHWLVNDTSSKPLEQPEGTRTPELWENNESSKTDTEEDREFEEWEAKMRDVTEERLKRWRMYGENFPGASVKLEEGSKSELPPAQHKKEFRESDPKNFTTIDYSSGRTTPKADVELQHEGSSKFGISSHDRSFERVGSKSQGNGRRGLFMNDTTPRILLNSTSETHKQMRDNKNMEMIGNLTNLERNSEMQEKLSTEHPTSFPRHQSTVIPPSKTLKHLENDDVHTSELASIVIALETSKDGKLLAKIINGKSGASGQDDGTNRVTITLPDRTKLFAPIFVLGSSTWISQLSKGIRQNRMHSSKNHQPNINPTGPARKKKVKIRDNHQKNVNVNQNINNLSRGKTHDTRDNNGIHQSLFN